MFIVKVLFTLIWHIMLMLLSAYMRVQAACVRVCVSQYVYFCVCRLVRSFVCMHVYIHSTMCVCVVCVCAVSLPPLAPPAEPRIGGDRRIDEIFNCRVFKRTTDALFC